MIDKKKYKKKLYVEEIQTLEWLEKNLPKHGHSAFIREAVKKEIIKIKK
jgi:hypothetical protein